MIINTSDSPDHVGGNASIRMSSMFGALGDGAAYQLGTSSGSSQQILAHVNVQNRMLEAKAADAPTDTYFTDKYTLYRFFNDQAVQIFHMPNAITDGDSTVLFRASDVIATGDIYNSDIYPPIDLRRGGSIDGEIEALNRVLDMSVTEYMAQGGTMIVPGHGWISDSADMGYYRDMLMIIRDRIQSMIDKGMTLEQVKAAKPTMDYDPEYGRQARRNGSIRRGRLRQSQAKEDEIVFTEASGGQHAHSVFFVVDCGSDCRRKSDGRSPPLLYRSLQCRQNDNDKRENHPDRASFSSLLFLCRVTGREWHTSVGDRGRIGRPVRAAGSGREMRSAWRPGGSDGQPVAHPKQHSGAAGEDHADYGWQIVGDTCCRNCRMRRDSPS